jgi:Haem-binding domain
MKRNTLKKGLWALVGVAVLAQLIRPGRTNPPITRKVRWDSEGTRQLARAACYDCHSNETVWPWYSNVAPVSWLIVHDVNEGRRHLDFSTWDRPNHDIDEIVKAVQQGEMPLRQYALMHPDARLDDEARAALVTGLRATLAADPPVPEPEGGHDRD